MHLKIKPVLAAAVLLMSATVCLGQVSECGFESTPCEAYAEADAVFIAKVVRISPQTVQMWQRDKDYDQTANLVIEKIYKGPKRTRLVLHQLARKNAPKLILGSRYLVYANFDRATKKWEVRRCGRTHLAKYVQDDLHYLAGLPASLNKTRIAGEVTRHDTDDENPQGTTYKLSGVRIRIKGEGKEYEVVTNKLGVYELRDVPAGKYRIEPDIPHGLLLLGVYHYGPFDRSKFRSLDVELKEGGCSGVGIILVPDNAPAKRRLIGTNALQ